MANRRKLVNERVARPSAQMPRYLWWGIVSAVIIVIAALVLWQLQGSDDQPPIVSNGFPTPIGFPETAQDVGTMEGKPAPNFALENESGQMVTVKPGTDQQPIVLIFNMGLG